MTAVILGRTFNRAFAVAEGEWKWRSVSRANGEFEMPGGERAVICCHPEQLAGLPAATKAFLSGPLDPDMQEALNDGVSRRLLIVQPATAAYRCPTCGADALEHCCGNRPYRQDCGWAPA